MIKIEGTMIAGSFDEEEKTFTLEQVKHLTTHTVLYRDQLEKLHHYLENCQNPEGQILALNDQILISLSREELKSLLHDLQTVQRYYM